MWRTVLTPNSVQRLATSIRVERAVFARLSSSSQRTRLFGIYGTHPVKTANQPADMNKLYIQKAYQYNPESR